MSRFVIKIELPEGPLLLEGTWTGTEEALEELYRRMDPDRKDASLWVFT